MAVPVIVYFFILNYIPMGGILMAFEDYSIKKGIFGSTFVGFDNFIRFFNSIYCWRVIRNTLLISLYGLLFSFPFPIIFALCLNEIRNTKFKKLTRPSPTCPTSSRSSSSSRFCRTSPRRTGC